MEPDFRSASAVPGHADIARTWWDENADSYLDDSPGIGTTSFQWCPEGWTEDDLSLLDPTGTILEIGAGSAPCSRWLASQGRQVTASDISPAMIAHASRLNTETGHTFDLIVAGIEDLPVPDNSFDIAFTSFGAIGFIPDLTRAFTEIARVLRPGGQWVYAATHPMSWIFPDSPFREDLSVIRPYGKRDVYVETSGKTVAYAEFSHTIADHMNALIDAGFTIERVDEPMWKPGHELVWGPWGPERGATIPGSLIVSARLASR